MPRWSKHFLVIAALLPLAGQEVKFSTSSNLVIVDVTVRDRSGKPIENLKKSDFAVLEDGKPQQIAVFEFQRLEEQAPAPAARPRTAVAAVRPAPAPAPAVCPGQVQYRDRRLLVLFFDLSSMATPDQIRAQQAALKFLDTQMSPADLVAIMSYGSKLHVDQDFTDDREALRQVIQGFRVGEASELAEVADTADANAGEDTGQAFTADQTEFNIFNTDLKLAAIESAVEKLAQLPEKKSLVYFSSGIAKTGVENQSQLRSTVNAAVKANVAIYPIDARGLTALVPGGDASKAMSRGQGIFTGYAQTQQRQQFNDQQETLSTLAADTGGKVFLDNNELSLGIVQAQRDVRSYYILGYYSTNPALDGRYRRIQVRLAGYPQAKLEHRQGYFGAKDFRQFNSEDKEHQLAEALNLGDPLTDLPLALEVNYFRISKGHYFVPVAVKIPGSEIALARRGSNETTEFDFVGQVTDEKGKPVSSVRDGIRVKLDQSNASKVASRSFQYETGFTLPPGSYRLKMVVRENQTGKLGTFETQFTVPDLAKDGPRLKLSSVVWSNQREALAAAVGAADKKGKLDKLNPLVQDGQKLVPSITRVFRRDQNLYVYAEVYDPGADPAPSVEATLTFLDGQKKVFESSPVRLTRADGARLPLQLQVPLGKLTPGRYTCQLNVVDEVGRKFAFPRAAVVVR